MRVYIWREYYAICDGCERDALDLGNGEWGFGENRGEAITVARKHGWKTLRGKFLCPECQKKETDK